MVDAAAARVTFPAYSRIQDNLPRLKSGIEKTLKLVNMTLFPLTGLLIVLAEPATRLVFGDKWLPALPALYLYSVAYLTVGTSNVLMNSLYALGRPEPVLRLSIFWAVGTWVLAVPLVLWIGWIGLPVATALLALTNIVLPLREVHKILPVAVMQSVLKPAFGALLSTGLVAMLGTMLNSTVPGLMLNAVCGMTVYIVCILVLDGRWLARELMPSLPHALSTRLLKTPLLGHLLDPSR